MFDTALANFHGEPGGMCVHAQTCGSQLALEHTGDLYSCDHYVEPGYLLGNIARPAHLEMFLSPHHQVAGAVLPICRDCGPARLQRRCLSGCGTSLLGSVKSCRPRILPLHPVGRSQREPRVAGTVMV